MKWFFGAAVLLLTALLLESGLLAYAMYVLLAVLIISRALARSWIEGISASRKCAQQTAEIGASVQVDITVRNAGWLPVPWVLLEDLLPQAALEQKPPRLRIKGKRLQIRMLPAGKEVKADYEIQCDMRGYYQIGPMVMESGDLFGLHRRYRVDAEPQYLLVYPKVVPLQGYDLASRRPIGDVRMIHRLFEDPTRISGVRPYEAGDPLNRVHWRATARTGMLHSKIYEPSTLAGATLLLDFHKAGYHRQGEPHRSELAVTTAASLANAVYELGQQIGLLSNGRDAVDRIRQEGWQHDHRTRLAAREKVEMRDSSARLEPLVVQTRRGMEQFQRIRETLARVELTDGLTTAELIIEVASRIPRDATVVAVLPDVSVETALALGTLRRQGFAVSAVLITLGPEQLEKSYGRLLAEGITDVRHLVSEEGLPELCRQQVRKATPYLLETDLT
ncbi:MAG TPA: DUF58 domain-containing protein [Gemmataceae bacterium]|jgi:uncharacterized protein (DUF58 family)|nr:DUF58 domain-containing protein [Gemmataceae bacterium]